MQNDTITLNKIVLTITAYMLLILFVWVDGIRHIESVKNAVLTLPHLVGCTALTRSILDAYATNHTLHTALFLSGLVTFSALA